MGFGLRTMIAAWPWFGKFPRVFRFQTWQAASWVVLAALLVGCGSEQSAQQSASSPDSAPASQVAELPTTPEPVATEPTPEPVAVPPVSGADGEESVDDILAELNAIKLEGDNSPGDPDKVVALMHEGNALIRAGQPDAALAKYNEALKFAEAEGDPDVFFNMGIAYKAKGDLDKASAEYKRALELAPEYSEAHNNLGNLLKDQKKFAEAILHFESSIKIFPDNPNTHNNLGTVYAMRGEVNKAAVYFAKAIRLQPSYIDARQNLGLAYIQQGRLDAAEREFSEALQMTKSIMLREEKWLEAAKLMMDQAKKPGSPLTYEQRNEAAGKLDAAEQASRVANAKYQRSLSLFQNILVRRQSAPKR